MYRVAEEYIAYLTLQSQLVFNNIIQSIDTYRLNIIKFEKAKFLLISH